MTVPWQIYATSGPWKAMNFQTLTSNPTVLLNYNDNLAGTLTLRVTDEDGTGRTTLLTRPLSTGEFPYKSP